MHPTNYDPCVYANDRADLLIALYVDDGMVIGASLDKINKLLKIHFEITQNEADCFLGLQIVRDRENKLTQVHQTAYTTRVLDKFNMMNCNSVSIPMDTHVTLKREFDKDGNIIKDETIPYSQLIGSLMFLAVGTRPDISFAVSKLSQFLEIPTTTHWLAAKRVLRYLQGTKSLGLTYGTKINEGMELTAFSDADYASCMDTRKSVIDIVLMLNGGPVIWSSRKQ